MSCQFFAQEQNSCTATHDFFWCYSGVTPLILEKTRGVLSVKLNLIICFGPQCRFYLILQHGYTIQQTAKKQSNNALVIGFPRGEPRAGVGILLIVHFKVLVFPHLWGILFLESPQYLAKSSTQLDLKMHFRTLFWFLEQLANYQTLHSDEN